MYRTQTVFLTSPETRLRHLLFKPSTMLVLPLPLSLGRCCQGGKPFGVGFVEVAVDQLASIISRQREPQADKALSAAVANAKADDLPCQARDRNPQITVASLETKADHQLIDLQRIAFESR